MIAPSTSSLADQLALIPDRVECLKELLYDEKGIPVTDKIRFFIGDKQFERGTQVGGAYKCGGCGCIDTLMQDLSYALLCPPRSLEQLQKLILEGKFGGQAGLLKPLEQIVSG